MQHARRTCPQPPRGGITWTIAGERLGLLAWPRAILLQLAHPLVAAGVAAHSGIRGSPFEPFVRLHRTVKAMRWITFGTDVQADAALTQILTVHDRVYGRLADATGVHRAGAAYSAHDPDLLLWVHATLLDSYIRVLGEVLRPFTPAERDEYCREASSVAVALGADRSRIPTDWPTLQEYMKGEIDSRRVEVGNVARGLARVVLRPSLSWTVWPIRRVAEVITIGTLPDAIREQYGFEWSALGERRLQRVLSSLARIRARMPDRIARWPEARGS